MEAERQHKSIVQPLLSPSSDHYEALQRTTSAIEDGEGHHRQGCALHSMVWDRTGAVS